MKRYGENCFEIIACFDTQVQLSRKGGSFKGVKNLILNFTECPTRNIIQTFADIKNIEFKLESLEIIDMSSEIASRSTCLFDFLKTTNPPKIIFKRFDAIISGEFIASLEGIPALKEVRLEGNTLSIPALDMLKKGMIDLVILFNNYFCYTPTVLPYDKSLTLFRKGSEKIFDDPAIMKIYKLKLFVLNKFSSIEIEEIEPKDFKAFKFYQRVGKIILRYLLTDSIDTENLFKKIDNEINQNIFKFSCVSKATIFNIISKDCVQLIGESMGEQSLIDIEY